MKMLRIIEAAAVELRPLCELIQQVTIIISPETQFIGYFAVELKGLIRVF